MSNIDNLVEQLSHNSNNTSFVEFHDDFIQNFSRYVLPNDTFNLSGDSAQSNRLREFENSFKSGYVSNVVENCLNYENQTQDFQMQNTSKMGFYPLKNKPISPNSCTHYCEENLNVISETDISSSNESDRIVQNYAHLRTDNSFYMKDIGMMTNPEYPIYTNLKKNILHEVFPTTIENQNKNKDTLAVSHCTFPENNKMNIFKDNQFMKNDHNSNIQGINNIYQDLKPQLSYKAMDDHMHHGSEFSVLNASQIGKIIFESTNMFSEITEQSVQINNNALCEKPFNSRIFDEYDSININKCSNVNSSGLNKTFTSPYIDMHNEILISSSHTEQCNVALKYKESDKKIFICDICAEGFALQNDLMYHNLIHIKEKYFVCDVCKYSFRYKCRLDTHYRIHTKENPFVCDVCCKAFNRKSNLKAHCRIHAKENPFVCHVCLKSFSQKKNLKTHYRVHTEENPFVCDVCCKLFTQKGHLKTHYRIHTNEKPFVCHVCLRAFKRKDNLTKHFRIHTKKMH